MLKTIIDLLCVATGPQINVENSIVLTCSLENEIIKQSEVSLPFKQKIIDEGTKYLGIDLKPCGYRMENWLWLPRKIQARVINWAFKTLSRGERLVLINFVMCSIPV